MVIEIRDDSDVPIYLQLRNQIVAGISDGRLAPGERLPTVRALAEELGVNVMTVNKAYQLLKQEGFLCTDRRNGARVRERPGEETGTLPPESVERLRILAAEARARGMDRADFLALCGQLYGKEEQL